MFKQKFFLICLSLLTIFALCACGDTAVTDSDVEGIQTFGETVDPSAQPSTGQVIESAASPSASANTVAPNASTSDEQSVDADDHENNDTTTVSSSGAGSSSNTPSNNSSSYSNSNSSSSTPSTAVPNTGGVENSEQNEDDGNSSPVISPPVAASEATIDEAQAYIGKSLSSLILDLGYPIRSDYDYVDGENPDAGEVGTLYFYGYVVTTIRIDGDETITGVSAN